jgi:putative membrane protein
MPTRTGADPAIIAVLVLLLMAAGAYAAGVTVLRRRADRWPMARTGAAAVALGCLTVTALPSALGGMTFPVHVLRHLLLAMAAPLALALSAPITLALRTLAQRPRRMLVVLVHSRFARAASTAPMVLILDSGGMYAFYLTPLYQAAHEHPWLNVLAHTHMFLAGCLLSWYLVGQDPVPRAISVRTRLVVLFLAGGSHDLLAKLLYAQALPENSGSTEQLHLGAQIMYYGGDLVELVLAVALMWTWYGRTGRGLRQEHRRGCAPVRGPDRAGLSLRR